MKIGLLHDINTIQKHLKIFHELDDYNRDISNSIKTALENLGHSVFLIEAGRGLKSKLNENKPDFVFNLSNKSIQNEHKANGPSILEDLEIPFTGSSSIACSLAYNKENAKKIFQRKGIRTPKFYTFTSVKSLKIPEELSFPLFLKPIYGGCSRGIGKNNLLTNRKSAVQQIRTLVTSFLGPYILEEFITGREFTVGVMGNSKNTILPILEIIFPGENRKSCFRDFSLKMINYDREKYICPARNLDNKRANIKNLAQKAYRAIGCRDYARVDIRMSEDKKPYVLEINALPSLIPKISSFAIMANESGMTFTQIIKEILNIAKIRYSVT